MCFCHHGKWCVFPQPGVIVMQCISLDLLCQAHMSAFKFSNILSFKSPTHSLKIHETLSKHVQAGPKHMMCSEPKTPNISDACVHDCTLRCKQDSTLHGRLDSYDCWEVVRYIFVYVMITFHAWQSSKITQKDHTICLDSTSVQLHIDISYYSCYQTFPTTASL